MKRRLFLSFLLALSWLGVTHVAYAGFGITPPYVDNQALRPGSEYTQEIIIVRSDPVEDLQAELSLSLPGIESWFSFDRGMSFTLPKGESQTKMHVTVRVPDDAKLGPYSGNIRIRTLSATGPSTGVSLALGARIDVNIKVVEEIFDFVVRRVELYEAEEGYRKWWLDYPGKISFAMHIENIGNVPASPPKVHIGIYDTSGLKLLEEADNSNEIESILPFATKKVYAYFPTKLPPGGYRVKYTIQKTDDAVAQKGELSLSILPHGTIPNYEGYGFAALGMGDKLSIIIPPVLLLLIILLIILSRRPSRRRPRRRDHDKSAPPEETHSATKPVSRARAPGGVVDLSRR